VAWHTVWANYDGYGAMMVGGLGLCYFFSTAAARGWFARGAFLGAVAIFAVLWLRSPRKGRTFMTGLVAAGVMTLSAASLHPDTFWAEIRSTFTEGTTSGTGEDRWTLWTAGLKVFAQRPLFGVGANNFGVFAATHFEYGDVGGDYMNPRRLYGRSLHSIYVQFLSERGIVGFAAFIWMLADFWKRNAAIRSPAAGERWRALGGRLELRTVALGIEASMVAFLVTAGVYSLVATPWFYTLLALNVLLHSLAVRNAPVADGARGRRGVRPRRIPTFPRPAGAWSVPDGSGSLPAPPR
jgi:O-antigen ligase